MSYTPSPNDTNFTYARPEQTWTKLPRSPVWVLADSAAVKAVSDKYAPPIKAPVYIPSGQEQRILRDLVQEGVPVVLTGPPGIGKTTLIRAVFWELGWPLQTFLASAATQVHELLGKMGTGGDSGELQTWRDGRLSLGVRAAAGGCISGFYLDEVIKLPDELASCLYSLLDNRATLSLPTGEEIETRGRLRLVFSYNPSKTKRLDDALRSRLTAIRMNYPPPKVETHVLLEPEIGNLSSLPGGDKVAAGMVRFSNYVRAAQGYEVEDPDLKPLAPAARDLLRLLSGPPSTRTLLVASRMVTNGGYSVPEAAEHFLIPSLIQDLHDFDLPALLKLLRRMAKELLPDTPVQVAPKAGLPPRAAAPARAIPAAPTASPMRPMAKAPEAVAATAPNAELDRETDYSRLAADVMRELKRRRQT